MKTAVTLLMLFALFPLSSFGQDYTRWSLPEGAKARLGKGHITGNITHSPDGTRFAMASSIGIWIYDAHAGKELALLTGHTEDVSGVSFSPDSSTLATGSGDKTVRLWEVNTGKHLRTLTGHTGGIETVSFSTDGSTLASASWDNTVRLWEVNTGKHLHTLSGHTGGVRSMAFRPDGSTLATGSGDGTVLLWEYNNSAFPPPRNSGDADPR